MVDGLDDPISFRTILRSVARETVDLIRGNKLAASFCALAFLVTLALALGIRYNERPRYREFVLPEIQRLETRFFGAFHDAEASSDRVARIRSLITAHEIALDVLGTARARQPKTAEGIRAHGALLRYYELMDARFATLRTEASVNPELDLVAEWKRIHGELDPLRDRWSGWVGGR